MTSPFGISRCSLPIWMLGALFYFSCASLSHAVIETYQFSDPSLHLRYKQLSAELRCPKCQNQNIADSDAPIARDLRKLLHRQLEAGASDDEIFEYMVARYGEFVLYRPRFEGVTLVLWLFPLILLTIAGLVVSRIIGRAAQQKVQAEGEDPLQHFEATLSNKLKPASKSEDNS